MHADTSFSCDNRLYTANIETTKENMDDSTEAYIENTIKNIDDSNDIILQNNMKIDNQITDVYLTKSQLCWCPTGKSKSYVNISHIIQVHYDQQKSDNDEIELYPSQQFTVHYVIKLKQHKLKNCSLTFNTSDTKTCERWLKILKDKVKEFSHPKKLLVFINPVGGRRQAQRIYKEKVAPLFDLAKIVQTIIVTERQDHAKDFLNTEDLTSYDGVVSVGGDGMFSEVMNGVLKHNCGHHTVKLGANAKPIRLGIIPAGSTDTVVYCTTGTNDPTTSALHILLGSSVSLDVCSVSSVDRFIKYSISLMGYGYFGDIIKDSDKLRWFGPNRYDIAGFKRFMKNKSYNGEVSFIQKLDHTKKLKCTAGCEQCSTIYEEELESKEAFWQTVSGKFISVIGANISCRCSRSSTGISPHAHLGDGYIDLILVRKTTRAKYLHHLVKVADKSLDNFNFNFIDVYRVKEFKFKSVTTSGDHNDNDGHADCSRKINECNPTSSVWNIDGELVEISDLHFKVHRQLITLYALGIEE
ncbi:ceramide kinase isoform X1 [Hydra vulgaris]|uniref:ceramide kinase isoform X1 n=1 Tax=Hydra vulgaris TaxID=6087 RepID=UPI001F5EE15F|nr:ceramide kinase isoform X1 [Hydra vulgaris]